MITLYKALVTDAAILSALAKEIYKEHYLHLWDTGGAEWYMETYAYAQHIIEKELANEDNEYILAVENGRYVGYLKLVLNAQLANYERLNALEVERVYLRTTAIGKGLGKKLLQYALEKARELNKEIIFLKAMDTSTEAIGFYKKAGYLICGSMQLPLPEYSQMKIAYRGMVILKRTV